MNMAGASGSAPHVKANVGIRRGHVHHLRALAVFRIPRMQGMLSLRNVTERIRTQLRLESFNLTNTPPLGTPNATVGAASFGTITTAGNPRQIQLGLKVLF